MNMSQRIVILSAFLSPLRSGAEAMVEEVSYRLSEQYDITILTGRYSRTSPREEMLRGSRVRIVRLGIGHALDKYLFPFLAPLAIRTLKPDIAHAVLESYAGLALVFTRYAYPRAKRVLTLQSTNISLLLGAMHASAHRITAISNALISRAQMYGRRDVTLIPNGVDTEALHSAVRNHTRVAHRVLFVGRLESMKGVDVLLAAFAQIVESLPALHDCHLRIVGGGSCRASLQSLSRSLGIETRVTFVGKLPPHEVYAEYAQAEVFCGLSRSEAFGNVFLEAQAAGCAVLATNVGGIPEIVIDGITGLCIEPERPTAAAKALSTLLTDAALRRRLIGSGMAHAATYDWNALSVKYGDVYDRVSAL